MECRAQGADFSNASFMNQITARSWFCSAVIRQSNLAYADFSGVTLEKCELPDNRWTGANVAGASFSGSDLSGGDFSALDWRSADFTHCDLTASELGDLDLRVVDLDWSAGKPERIAGSEHEVPAQLVLIACGFTGPEHGVFNAVGVPVATAGRPLPVMAAEGSHLAARVDGVAADAAPVYVAGDARNGSSLVVNAMADALACAAEVAEALEL